jgi:hypothetical protein
MQQRRHLEHLDTIEQRVIQEALRLRNLADAMGVKREWLLKRAMQCEARSRVSKCPRSPDLQPPKCKD